MLPRWSSRLIISGSASDWVACAAAAVWPPHGLLDRPAGQAAVLVIGIAAAAYATVLGWPAGGDLTLHVLFRGNPYLPAPVCAAELLGSSQPIPLRLEADGLHLTLPGAAPTTLPDIDAYVLRLHTSCSGSKH